MQYPLSDSALDQLGSGTSDLILSSQRHELVFIASDVADIGQLVAGLGPQHEVVLFDTHTDGLEQMLRVLAGRSGLEALHIVAHGSSGSLQLGSLVLDAVSALARAADLQVLGQALAAGADILIYGCDVGSGTRGATLLDLLAQHTGADVAASNDRTGHIELGGDWELEVQRGEIETAPLVDPAVAALYRQTLATGVTDTISFDNFDNFSQAGDYDAGADVVYLVGGDAAMGLRFSGTDSSTHVYSHNSYVNLDAAGAGDSAIRIGFEDERVFSVRGVTLTDMQTAGQDLIITGYDGSGALVDTVPVTIAGKETPTIVDLTSNLLINITHFVITAAATSHGGKVIYLTFDDLELGAIAPRVSSVSSSNANQSYTTGDLIAIEVQFTQKVTVTGIPTLQLDTGNGTSLATYASGSGSDTVVFHYTVKANDSVADLDYASASALQLAGGTIFSVAEDEAAQLSLPAPGASGSLADNKDIVLDTSASMATVVGVKLEFDTGWSSTDGITRIAEQSILGTLSAPLKAGEKVQVSFNGSSWIDAVIPDPASAPLDWSAPVTLLSSSTTIHARVSYGADQVSATYELGYQLITDTPSVLITAHKLSLRAGETALVTFAFSANPDTVTGSWNDVPNNLEVVGGTLSAISGTGLVRTAVFTPAPNVASGVASIQIANNTWFDLAGNVGGVSNVEEIYYDTKRPDPPSKPVLVDPGLALVGNLLTAIVPTFTGKAEPGTTVKLYADGVFIGSGLALPGDGDWSITTLGPLVHGQRVITATATDHVGNVSASSDSLPVTVDVEPPTTTIASLTMSGDSGSSNSDFITNVAGVTLSGSLSAALKSDEKVVVSLNGGASYFNAMASTGSTTWSYTTTLTGSGDLIVAVRDNADNLGRCAPRPMCWT